MSKLVSKQEWGQGQCVRGQISRSMPIGGMTSKWADHIEVMKQKVKGQTTLTLQWAQRIVHDTMRDEDDAEASLQRCEAPCCAASMTLSPTPFSTITSPEGCAPFLRSVKTSRADRLQHCAINRCGRYKMSSVLHERRPTFRCEREYSVIKNKYEDVKWVPFFILYDL